MHLRQGSIKKITGESIISMTGYNRLKAHFLKEICSRRHFLEESEKTAEDDYFSAERSLMEQQKAFSTD